MRVCKSIYRRSILDMYHREHSDICVCVWLWAGGGSVLSYLRGEHGQESDGPTLHALHPEQGVAVVLPAELHIKHPDEEQVHAHEAVRT